MLDQLSGEWVDFQQCLIDSDVMLKKSKEKFKTGLIHSSEEFKKTVGGLFEDFQTKGPFSSGIAVKEVSTVEAFRVTALVNDYSSSYDYDFETPFALLFMRAHSRW